MENKHNDPYAMVSSLYELFNHDDQVFRALAETIPVIIYAYGGTRFIYANKTFEKTLGYSRDELVKMDFWEVCHPDHQELIRQRGLARLRGEEVPDHYEIKAQKKTGEIVWADVFFSLTEMRGEPISIVGAFDITERKRLEADLQQAREELKRFSGAQAIFKFDDIIYRSAAMQHTVNIASAAARNRSTVVLEGESGTGKEMFAQAIHNAGSRSRGPFVAVNCGAIPRELIGSELFGYTEGAFTGAKKGGNPGKFELASGGTLFLDEIADMPLEQQVNLLRVIQEKKLIRIGGNDVIPVDVRIICATNKNLLREVEQGNFRHDLYYRLNIINIRLPNLRERPDDIPLLFNYFVSRLLGYSWSATPGILDHLVHYPWPGNVRELQNVAERMVYLASFDQPDYEALLPALLPSGERESTESTGAEKGYSLINYHQQQQKTRKEYEKNRILELLIKYDGNLSKVSKELGIARSTLYRKMHQYKIT